jgi:hypothetical protein
MKKLFLTLVLAVILLTNLSVHAQTQQWTAAYNNSPHDILEKIVADNTGNVYITGQRQPSSSVNEQFLVKYNTSGTFQWQRFFAGPYSNLPNYRGTSTYACLLDNSGNILLAGSTDSSFYSNKGYIVKYNSNGDTLWKKYAGINDTLGFVEWYSMQMDNSGNIYVAGYNYKTFAALNRTFIVAKYNSSGALLWVKTQRPQSLYGTTSTGFKLLLDNGNNIFVSATIQKTGSSSSKDWYFFKLNNSGILQWESSYNGPADGEDLVSSATLDLSGNLYIEGVTLNISPMNKEITCIKLNGSTGAQQWIFKADGMGSSGDDEAYNLAAGNSNDIYITGALYANSTGSNGVLIKLNSSTGGEVWRKTLQGVGSGSDMYTDVKVTYSGFIYAVGVLDYFTSANAVQTKKFNTNGDSLAGAYYTMGNNVFPRTIVPGPGNTLLIGGDNTYNSAASDVFVVKYGVTTNMNVISNTVPGNFSLSQNYPNPFNPTTEIGFNLPKDENVTLEIFDSMGRKISELTKGKFFNAGYHRINFEAKTLTSGIYFYKITAGEFSETKKMMLVK